MTKNTPEPVLMVDLISPRGTLDSLFMKNYATVYLLDRIKCVDGVGNVDFFGGDYSMRIAKEMSSFMIHLTNDANTLETVAALCILILRPREKKSAMSFGGFKSLSEFFMRRKIFAVMMLVATTVGAVVLNDILPSEYIPDEDENS